jgi:hypothetical protein
MLFGSSSSKIHYVELIFIFPKFVSNQSGRILEDVVKNIKNILFLEDIPLYSSYICISAWKAVYTTDTLATLQQDRKKGGAVEFI